jgi:hypothetical protein
MWAYTKFIFELARFRPAVEFPTATSQLASAGFYLVHAVFVLVGVCARTLTHACENCNKFILWYVC